MAGPLTVAGLTVGWPVSSAALLWLSLVVGFSGNWKEHNPGRDIATKLLLAATLTVFVFGPSFIAMVAYRSGLRRTAVGYTALSGLLLVGTVIQFIWSPL